MHVRQFSEIPIRVLHAVADVDPEHHGAGVLGIHLGVTTVRRTGVQDPALAGEKSGQALDGFESVAVEVPLRVMAERRAAVVLGAPPLPGKALDRLALPLGELIGPHQQRHAVFDAVHGTGWRAQLTGRDFVGATQLLGLELERFEGDRVSEGFD
jgi:hypothetical protein